MILKQGHSIDYLMGVKSGNIQMGLGIENRFLDEYIRFKRGQINMILGFDNVGKSYWFTWYALALSSHHNLKWCFWMGEDEVGEVMINLIQMYSGIKYDNLSEKEITRYMMKIEHWFDFIDNSKIYTPQELLLIFKESDADGFFIDPYTGLKRGYGFSDNYDFLNEARAFCNQNRKTLYISLHPSTESGRNTGVHPKEHSMAGHMKPPKKADAEGGQSFANRADDFWVIHRYPQHETQNHTTYVHVKKNKRNRTGGKPTLMEFPVSLDFNYGLGFTIGGYDPIKRNEILIQKQESEPKQESINFYEPKEKEEDIDYTKEIKSLKTNGYEEYEDFFKMPGGEPPF
jgi:hypothetical protein